MDDFRVLRHEAALRDLAAIIDYLVEQANPQVALRFINAAERSFDLLAHQPMMGKAYASDEPRLRHLRSFRISGFANYLIYYRPLSNGIAVVRVLHGARNQDLALQEEASE